MARLDRYLVSEEWDNYFRGVSQSILPKPASDHSPILLDGVAGLIRGPMPFRFENMWLKAKGFHNLMADWWANLEFRGAKSYVMMEKMKAPKVMLRSWNKETFGIVEERKKQALQKVDHWDNIECLRPLSHKETGEKANAVDE